jgi:two-component system, OmpR family, manganese sensing sensor histidine kinase
MFRSIRQRLLLYYLMALASTLGVFGVAMRIIFTHIQSNQLHAQLTTLAQGAIASVDLENEKLVVGSDYSTIDLDQHGQAIQWFDLQRRMIGSQGKAVLKLPLIANQIFTIHASNPLIQGVTLPILNSDSGRLIGYVRASQSLEESDEALQKLDWGLAISVTMALLLSGAVGIWLTQQAMQPIEESFDRLKQFTADAAHELRSPLMAIQSNAEVSLKYPAGMRPDDAESLQAITSATRQMVRLTEDLLLLARADKLPQQLCERINLVELLHDLGNLYSATAVSKQVVITVKPSSQPIYTLGNTDQIKRLFTNLIVNTVQHTPAGGNVKIVASFHGETTSTQIIDTGVGIAPEHLGRIFDRFWRADQSRTYRQEGSGLGLSIAQAIAQSHGGVISVISKIDCGSCFTVYLPRIINPN